MDAGKLHAVLKQKPFEAVRFFVSDGKSYDIRHPDQVVLSRRAAHIGIGRNGAGPFQSIAIVALVQITRVEPIGRGRKASK